MLATAADISYHPRQLHAIFWLIAVVLGALDAWAGRQFMLPMGISYLDMADAFGRGDWSMTINGLWSPFYPWTLGVAMMILKPPPSWEFSVAHLVNYIVYLFSLSCFTFFLRELIRYHRDQKVEYSRLGCMTLPEWVWLALGYSLFIWSSLLIITVRYVTPDMFVAAFVYLASAILLRIRRGVTGGLVFIGLGLVLGCSYLAKAAMFPTVIVFLIVSMFLVSNLKRAVSLVAIALVVFLSIGSIYFVPLSKAKGHWTLGDSAKLNYLWHLNKIPSRHWQGQDSSFGIPTHATRKIFDTPAIYEFGSPIKGTYPPWDDPSYWYQGVTPRFDLGAHQEALVQSAKAFYSLNFSKSRIVGTLALVGGFLIFLYVGRRWWLWMKDIAKEWSLLVPAIGTFFMYSLIHLEPRYVAPFLVLLWLGVFSGVRLSECQRSRKVVTYVMVAMTVLMTLSVGVHTALATYSSTRNLLEGETSSADVEQVADGLNRMGVQAGDKIAIINFSESWKGRVYWARLARVQIVAELPTQASTDFVAADQLLRSQVMNAFARTGAKVVVANDPPAHFDTSEWQKLGNTDYYAFTLPKY